MTKPLTVCITTKYGKFSELLLKSSIRNNVNWGEVGNAFDFFPPYSLYSLIKKIIISEHILFLFK